MASKINFNTIRQRLLLNVLQKQKFKALYKTSGELSFPLTNIQRKPYSTENDSSDSDDEKKPIKSLDTKKDISSVKSEASKKLTALLSSIKVENSNSTDKKRVQLNLAKPGGSKKLKEQVKQHYKAQTSPLTYETSSELEEKELNEAVTNVAKSLGGDVKKTESDLLKRLKSHATETRQGDKESSNMSEIFLGMKIDREKPKQRVYNHKYDRVEMDEPFIDSKDKDEGRMKRYQSESYRMINTPLKVPYQKIDLFGHKPLGFFQSGGQPEEKVSKSIWERLEEKELKLLVTHPPENGFEEMIKWTEEGKLWHFPINNEFGLDEEANVRFEEHVFLEPLLEGFPSKGPIRHFMELVVVGLSKNPYISVQRKRENIEWFRQYFQEKESFLKEIVSLDDTQETSAKDFASSSSTSP